MENVTKFKYLEQTIHLKDTTNNKKYASSEELF